MDTGYGSPMTNTAHTLSYTLPAGSMSTDGAYDWSGTEVTATVYEDGLWLILDDEGSQWATGRATSVTEAQAAVTSAVGG